MRSGVFTFILLLAFNLSFGQYIILTDTVEVFGEQVMQLLERTSSKSATRIGDDFNALWPSQFSASQQKIIINTALAMQKRNFQHIPYFRDYFGVITSAVNTTHLSGDKLGNMLDMLSQSLELQKPEVFHRELMGIRIFFEHSALHYSRNNSLYVIGEQYDFDFVPPSVIEELPFNLPDETIEETQAENDALDNQEEGEQTDPWAETEDDGWGTGAWDNSEENEEETDATEDAPTLGEVLTFKAEVEQPPDEGSIIRFQTIDLAIVTRYDSTFIKGTKGSFLPGKYMFIGDGGTFDWSLTGLEEKQIYVKLSGYHFNVRRPGFKAEDVKLYYTGLLDQPAEGIFEYRSLKHKTPEDVTYPRFISYENNNKISIPVGANIRFKGGVSLKGQRRTTSCLSNGRSVLKVSDEKGRKFRAEAVNFDIGDSLITARNAEITIYQGNDSITHPSVKFRYYLNDNELVVVKELGGFKVRPFSSSYYQMSIDADLIKWNLEADSINISVMNAKSMLPAFFKSTEYFDQREITELSGVYKFNPLLLVYHYGNKIKSREFYVDDLVKHLKLKEKPVRAAMLQLYYLDFIDYDELSGRIYLKDKAIHFVKSKNNKKDFDELLIPSLSPDKPNATLHLDDNELTVRGIEKFYISEMLDVYIFPTNNEISLLKNRDFKFDGQIFAGNFEFVGRDFTFRYDSFLVDLQNIDSIRFYVDQGENQRERIDNKMVSNSQNGQEEGKDLSFVQEGTNGILYINRPDNKSGRRLFPQYPLFNAERGAIVNFSDQNTLNGAYDNTMYFEVPPFAIDSLSSSDPAAIGFEGTFVGGDILPEFKETLRIMPDNSLGFDHAIPEEGYNLYGGDARIFNRLKLDKNGLVANGIIKHLSSTITSNAFTLYQDSVIADHTNFELLAGDYNTVSYPGIVVDSASLNWRPFEDEMVLENDSVPFDLYEHTASLDGSINLTSKGVMGEGVMRARGFESHSQEFAFKENDMQARHAFFRLNSENEEKPLLTGDDIGLKFDFIKNVADLSPEIEGMAAFDFPYAQIKTSISNATWDLSEGKVYMVKPEDVPIESSYFYTTREDLDSLAFNAEAAEYDLKTSELKVSGIPHIVVADAYIIPENNEVMILENATIGELHNTTIIIDTLNEYHHLVDGSIQIHSRTDFSGQATYQFINARNDTFNIKFGEFELWRDPLVKESQYQTISSGVVEDGILISNGILFKGKMKMYARKKALELEGFVKLDLSSNSDYDIWVKYSSNDEEVQDVMFDFNTAVTADGEKLDAGIFYESMSRDMYSVFAGNKKLVSDDELFRADGLLYYDIDRDMYMIEDTAKANGSKLQGKVFGYNDASGNIEFEGPLNIVSSDEQIKIMAAGSGQGNTRTNEYTMDIMAKIDYKMDNHALAIMAADIFEVVENLNLAEAESDKDAFLYKVAEFIGDRAASDYDRRTLDNYIPIASFSSALAGSLMFSKVDLTWSPEHDAWYSTGKLGFSNILKYDINGAVDGFMEIVKTEEKGDIVNIFIQVSSGCWYFFNYEENRLMLYSSNKEFNDQIVKKSNIAKAGFGEYVFTEGDQQDVLKFIDRFRLDYLGIKEPYELSTPIQNVDTFVLPAVGESESNLEEEDGFGDENVETIYDEGDSGFGDESQKDDQIQTDVEKTDEIEKNKQDSDEGFGEPKEVKEEEPKKLETVTEKETELQPETEKDQQKADEEAKQEMKRLKKEEKKKRKKDKRAKNELDESEKAPLKKEDKKEEDDDEGF